MNAVKIPMGRDKKIALVAHDNMKRDLLEWATFNRDLLAHHVVYATPVPRAAFWNDTSVSRSTSCRADRSAATSRSARESSARKSTS